MYSKHILYSIGRVSIGVLICITCFCLPACNNHSNSDCRTKEQAELLKQVSDSVLRASPVSTKWCDSLISKAPDSLTYYDYYMLKGRYHLVSDHPDSALTYINKTRAFASKQPPSPRVKGLLAIANSTEASCYHLLRHSPDKVISLNTTAYEQIMGSDVIDFAPEVSANLADAYVMINDIPDAAKWYRRALLLVDSLNLPNTKNITLYMGLGQIYTILQDYKTAKYYYQLTERQFSKMKPNMQAYFINNYGNVFYYEQDYPHALTMFNRLKKLLESYSLEDKSMMYICKINLADVYLNLGKTDSAEVYLNQVEPYFKKLNIDAGIYYANTIRIGIAITRRQYNKVEEILKKEKHIELTEQIMKNIRSRYMDIYYKHIGNYRMAYENLNRNISENNAAEHNRINMRASEIMMHFTEDTLKLRQQLTIKENKVIRDKAQVTTWASAGITLILLLVIALGAIYSRKRRLQNHIDIIMLRLGNARQRISPHFVFNVLNTKIGSANKEEADVLLKLTKLIRANLDMTGRTYVTLREELDFVNRYVAIERTFVGDDFEFIENIQDENALNETQVPAMFIQILVENAIKHGLKCIDGHKILTINVNNTQDSTEIDVIDNGPGFDIRRSEGRSTGVGLNVIRRTLAIINQQNKKSNKMIFNIKNIESEDGTIMGCKSSLRIPKTIKFI